MINNYFCLFQRGYMTVAISNQGFTFYMLQLVLDHN